MLIAFCFQLNRFNVPRNASGCGENELLGELASRRQIELQEEMDKVKALLEMNNRQLDACRRQLQARPNPRVASLI